MVLPCRFSPNTYHTSIYTCTRCTVGTLLITFATHFFLCESEFAQSPSSTTTYNILPGSNFSVDTVSILLLPSLKCNSRFACLTFLWRRSDCGGAVVNRTYGTHTNLYICLFLLTVFGPIHFAPRNSLELVRVTRETRRHRHRRHPSKAGFCFLSYWASAYSQRVLLILRGAMLNRTYGTHKNPYIYLFFMTIFGPIYYGPP